MEEVAVVCSRGYAEDVLEGLCAGPVHGQRLNLLPVSMVRRRLVIETSTILSDASAKLTKVGTTSPSSPAASSWEASHSDNTVPTSCAKHSFHVLSGLGLPPKLSVSDGIRWWERDVAYASRGREVSESTPLGRACSSGCSER